MFASLPFGLALCAALAIGLALGPAANAKGDFPAKPVTLLVGYGTGEPSAPQAHMLAELVGKDR